MKDVLIIHNGYISNNLKSLIDIDYPRPEWFHQLISWGCACSRDPDTVEEEISGQPNLFDAIVLVGLLEYQRQILEERSILNRFAKEGARVVVYQALVTYRQTSYNLSSAACV